MSQATADWVHLQSPHLSLAIDPQGAQLSQLRDAAGRDLLWDGDARFWNGRAPILFPIVGALHEGRYLWNGQHYTLPRHGFARGRRFAVIQSSTTSARFRQTFDAETLKVYPFHFELDLQFELVDRALRIEAIVRNLGAEPMPASVGFHPALRWPLPGGAAREAHDIEFEFEETAGIRRLDAKGLLLAERRATPVLGRQLSLTDELFAEDVVIFDQLASRRLTYGARNGPRVAVSFPDATHLGLWTKPGAGFICIEPWRGVADPAGFAASLQEKPGIFLVAPGGSQSLCMQIGV